MMNYSKNCVFFVTSLNSGGIENYLLRFLRLKKTSFNNIFVFCKSGDIGQLQVHYEQISNLRIKAKRISFFNPFHYYYLYRFLKKNNFDSVCDFTGNFAGGVLFAAKKAQIKKRIAFYRGSTNHFNESRIKLLYNKWMNILINKYATDILSNSKTALDFFYPNRIFDDKRFDVIYNGIDANSFLSTTENIREELKITESDFVVGHIGRYTEAKNHKLIIKVAIELCKSYSDIHFILCGNGVDTNLNQIVIDNNLTNKIHLLGYRQDIIRVYNSLDCFYLPSLTEGQPNALIEAMICGLPFVVSDINSIKEIVPSKYHDLLVNVYSPDESISRILEIYSGNIKINLKKWAINKFDSKELFASFFNKL